MFLNILFILSSDIHKKPKNLLPLDNWLWFQGKGIKELACAGIIFLSAELTSFFSSQFSRSSPSQKFFRLPIKAVVETFYPRVAWRKLLLRDAQVIQMQKVIILAYD
jgi:hypothetical protein